jgi:hypothetical protein
MPLFDLEGNVIGDPNDDAKEKLNALPSFTIGECMAIHTALHEAYNQVQLNREDLLSRMDKATFNIVANDIHGAKIKIEKMAKAAIAEQRKLEGELHADE